MTDNDLRFRIDFLLTSSPKDLTFTDTLTESEYDTLLGGLGSATYADVKGMLKMVGPASTFYQNTGWVANDFSSPEIDGNTSDWSETGIELPLSGSLVQQGTYTFYYKIRVGYDVPLYSMAPGIASSIITIDADVTGQVSIGDYIDITSQTANDGIYPVTNVTYNAGTGRTSITITASLIGSVTDEVFSVIYETSKSINYCLSYPSIDLGVSSLCSVSQLTAEDETVYQATCNSNTYDQISLARAWTIIYPASVLSNVSASTSSVTIGAGTSYNSGANIYTGAYSISLVSTVKFGVELWDTDYWFTATTTLTGSASHTVECSSCICDIDHCIDALFDKYKEAVTNNRREAERLELKVRKVLMDWMQYQIAERCGESSSEYCASIESIVLSENCTCTSSDTTTPEEVIPWSSGGSGSASCCSWSSGTVSAGFPSSPSSGDFHIFTNTSGAYTAGDVYTYNGSSWVFALNITGTTGATGAAGADGGGTLWYKQGTYDSIGSGGGEFSTSVTYNMPADTLTQQGDTIRIVITVEIPAYTGGSTPTITDERMFGFNFLGGPYIVSKSFGYSTTESRVCEIEAEVSYLTASTAWLRGTIKQMNVSKSSVSVFEMVRPVELTGLDFTSSTKVQPHYSHDLSDMKGDLVLKEFQVINIKKQ